METSKDTDQLRALEEKVASHPHNIDDVHDLADAYADLGQWEKAVDAYSEALALDKSNADLHNSLGIAYEEVEKPDRAIQSYQRAIELAPEDALAYHNLGTLLEDRARPEEAVEIYQQGTQHVTDRQENSAIKRKLFALTSRTATGQSPLAYRVAAIELLAGGVLVNSIGTALHPNLTGAASVLIDVILAMGLFRLRPGARNFTLFRVVMGAVVSPILVWVQRTEGDTAFAVLTILLNWSYCGALLLLLTGQTRTWRIVVSVFLAASFTLASLVVYALILVPLFLR